MTWTLLKDVAINLEKIKHVKASLTGHVPELLSNCLNLRLAPPDSCELRSLERTVLERTLFNLAILIVAPPDGYHSHGLGYWAHGPWGEWSGEEDTS